jgi:hypothetical protein
MVQIKITLTVKGGTAIGTGHYIGASIDAPLPTWFWTKGYTLGIIVNAEDKASTTKDLQPGTHYIVFGTSADINYGEYHLIEVKVESPAATSNQIQVFHNHNLPNNSQYGYVVFTVTQSGVGYIKNQGNIAPNTTPSGTEEPQSTNYTLSLYVGAGGKVDVTIGGVTNRYLGPWSVSFTYPSGTQIVLDAIPDTSYYFKGWYDDGNKVSGSNRIYVTLNQNMTRKALFEAQTPPPPNNYILTINVGTNGKLYVDNTPYTNTNQQLTYTSGTVVSLRAEPDEGYLIDTFTIDGNPVVQPMSGTLTVTMDTNHTVNISFLKNNITSNGKPPDISDTIQKMMNTMMQIMMPMMGMMMMMQMMTSLISSIGGAV